VRVIGGKVRGRTLLSVPGDSTRPILDRAKQTLFDVLRPSLEGTTWLDLFAGTGSVGIEALSQGAESCIFVDVDKKATEVIKENLKRCNFKDPVRHQDAFTYLRNTRNKFDIIYVAPPQYKSLWVRALQDISERPNLLNDRGRVIVQIDPKEDDDIEFKSLKRVREKKIGNTLLIFYEAENH